jgi:hypothetical protein
MALLKASSKKIWRAIQLTVWIIGLVILYLLLFQPRIGVLVFWNILIPVAPLLFVLSVGVWRNVCPLAITNLLPRHFGFSKRKHLSVTQLGILNLIGILMLYIIVPLRHAIFNNNGVATGLMIITMACIGFTLSFFYEWKSAWCSGLCPIHPVEKLYGSNVLFKTGNAHCVSCEMCVIPCPDSTQNMQPNKTQKHWLLRFNAWLIIGGLPGFIYGWFHVPDISSGNLYFKEIINNYTYPIIGLMISLSLYTILFYGIKKSYHQKLVAVFAAASVSCYYWYRIPSLVGLGGFANDGLLINLSSFISIWQIKFLTSLTTLFFFYWLVFRAPNKKSWSIRPF